LPFFAIITLALLLLLLLLLALTSLVVDSVGGRGLLACANDSLIGTLSFLALSKIEKFYC
jgi:hypothetical protein